MSCLAIATHYQLKPPRAPGWYLLRLNRAAFTLDDAGFVLADYRVVEGPYRKRTYAAGRLFKLSGIAGGLNGAEAEA